jgi:hypothetical protein
VRLSVPSIVAQRSNQERYSSKKTSLNQRTTTAIDMTMSRKYKPISHNKAECRSLALPFQKFIR